MMSFDIEALLLSVLHAVVCFSKVFSSLVRILSALVSKDSTCLPASEGSSAWSISEYTRLESCASWIYSRTFVSHSRSLALLAELVDFWGFSWAYSGLWTLETGRFIRFEVDFTGRAGCSQFEDCFVCFGRSFSTKTGICGLKLTFKPLPAMSGLFLELPAVDGPAGCGVGVFGLGIDYSSSGEEFAHGPPCGLCAHGLPLFLRVVG